MKVSRFLVEMRWLYHDLDPLLNAWNSRIAPIESYLTRPEAFSNVRHIGDKEVWWLLEESF